MKFVLGLSFLLVINCSVSFAQDERKKIPFNKNGERTRPYVERNGELVPAPWPSINRGPATRYLHEIPVDEFGHPTVDLHEYLEKMQGQRRRLENRLLPVQASTQLVQPKSNLSAPISSRVQSPTVCPRGIISPYGVLGPGGPSKINPRSIQIKQNTNTNPETSQ